MSETAPDMTELLSRWKAGDRDALTEIATHAYVDLRAMAGRQFAGERSGHTLQATGLVNELYLRLRQMKVVDVADRHHFYALAAQVMRRILLDHARRTRAQKRPGRQVRVPLHEELAWCDAASDDIVDLESALEALGSLDERKLRAVEYRYLLGCSEAETADLLGVSGKTIARDLEFSKTWLYRRLRGDADAPEQR